jgi:hypothetical protein
MSTLSKRVIAACGLLAVACYCFVGALQSGSSAVAGAADPRPFHRNARTWFALAVAAGLGAFVSGALALRVRVARAAARPESSISGNPEGLYVDASCCLDCGVPWTVAPSVFAEGPGSCVVRHQPASTTELRRVLRVFRSQDLNCVRYGGRDLRALAILRRAGCADACDADSTS